MILPLRRLHYAIWRLWAVLLPVGFVSAILVRPSTPFEHDRHAASLSATIRPHKDSTYQIRVVLDGVLTIPACVVSAQYENHKIMLGQLEQSGAYLFEVRATSEIPTLVFTDPFHRNEIARFKPSIMSTNPEPQ